MRNLETAIAHGGQQDQLLSFLEELERTVALLAFEDGSNNQTASENIFRLSPGFCFADGLASLALLRQGMKDGSGDGVFDWNVAGAALCYLAAEAERSRVLSGSMDKAIIYLRNLRKVYPGWNYHGTKVAVHSLTFAVQEGECFGFLGTNGAGKTTTLSMLSGEVRPSDGNAFIYGKDISSNPKAAHHHVVMEKIVEFDLLKRADKPSLALSRGNKRKLSVAIAMIGDPPIVILDEPSTAEVSSEDLENLCRIIQEKLFDKPTHPRSLISDLEVCIGGSDCITSESASVAEISMSEEMIVVIGGWLGNQERVGTLVSSACDSARVYGEELSEQLVRDGGIPLPIFSEWWLAKEKFSTIDAFILSSFPGATFQGCNGLSANIR
ncbi:hypothetical protein Vadar_026504 [Vaccinium darrowii]|uniref:Uncharacterized protein n=1 Tax=Vaccinium darrowii TaxID=229202 RepID=A0ACB7YRV0_9ERIC|nr:hypothetical protein Vadar_026504 [Vaccinium darrowii]